MLIHPVGIGLASWFWEPLMNQPGPAMYAPNLIGCGISEGGDSWDPLERGLFIPLGWVKGCEALLQQIVKGEKEKNDSSIQQQFAPTNLFKNSFKSFPLFGNKKVNVVTQGGLAPIGVLLAARNPNVVQSLVMASPPTWKDMTNPVPREELERNYGFLRSPILGDLAFRVLESRRAIEFFSNQFLFSKQCDDVWLKKTESEFGVQARPPVQVFNAGFCMNRGLETELTSLTQPTIIVQGQEDKRERKEYVEMMKNCRIQVSPGKNVIPWEFPQDFANLLFGRY
jgi:pimeloyl-ACP methyl ester carboxylesterase